MFFNKKDPPRLYLIFNKPLSRTFDFTAPLNKKREEDQVSVVWMSDQASL